MNSEKQVITAISQVTGLPEEEILSDSLFKDLGVSEDELRDILDELRHKLDITLESSPKDLKSVRDVIEIVSQNSPLLP